MRRREFLKKSLQLGVATLAAKTLGCQGSLIEGVSSPKKAYILTATPNDLDEFDLETGNINTIIAGIPVTPIRACLYDQDRIFFITGSDQNIYELNIKNQSLSSHQVPGLTDNILCIAILNKNTVLISQAIPTGGLYKVYLPYLSTTYLALATVGILGIAVKDQNTLLIIDNGNTFRSVDIASATVQSLALTSGLNLTYSPLRNCIYVPTLNGMPNGYEVYNADTGASLGSFASSNNNFAIAIENHESILGTIFGSANQIWRHNVNTGLSSRVDNGAIAGTIQYINAVY